MRDRKIRVIRTDVGDRYVVQEMRDHGFNLGGEQSGHIVFLDQNTTGDGILAALQMLSILQTKNQPLSEVKKVFMALPQVLLNVRIREKSPLEKIPGVAKAIQACEQAIQGRGRVLVRYSGTEMIARVMVEGEDPERIRTFADNIASKIHSQLGAE